MPLKIKIKRLDKSLPLPKYQTNGSSGLDLYSRQECILKSGEFKTIPTGIAINIPFGKEAQVRPRSGLASSYGIGILNSPGTIDSDYRGEVKVILFNLGKEDFNIKKGDRVAQLVISTIEVVELEEVDELEETERNQGGFGSTDK